MRWLILLLLLLLVALQYKLWFADGGVQQVKALHGQVAEQKNKNEELKKQNEQLHAEVKDLKQGIDAADERARNELGMVQKNEQYYQVVQERKT